MATVAANIATPFQRERQFFLYMALAIAVAVVGGFGIRILLGITDFSRPWWVHLHAVTFMSWIGFYVLQNLLVANGSIVRHRRLGAFGAIAAIWVSIVGLGLTGQTLAAGNVPPFFDPAYFLAQNSLYIVFFAALTCAAIALRNRPDWHRRLMLCATLIVSLPGFARWIILIAPPPDAFKHAISFALFLVPALLFDLTTYKRIHPAYWVGGGAIVVLEGAAIPLLASFPPFAALALSIAP